MSGIEHIDVDHEDFEGSPKALRDHVKKLQAALTERDKTISEFRGKETERALSSVLTGFKNPGRVQRDLLADKVDPLDTEAVSKWLEANGDDYARGEGATAETPASATETLAEAYARTNSPALRRPSEQSLMEAIAALPDDLSPDQLAAEMRALGA